MAGPGDEADSPSKTLDGLEAARLRARRGVRRLAAVTAAMVAGLAAVGLWLYRAEHARLLEEAEQDLQVIAGFKVEQISAWRAERLADAATLTESPLLAQSVARFLGELPEGVSPEAEEALRGRLISQREREGYDHVMLLDVQGRVRLSDPALGVLSEPDLSASLARALSARVPTLTDLHRGPGDLPPHIDVVAPLMIESRPLGAIVLRTHAERFLYPLITSWPTRSRTAETLLVRRDGDDVLFLNDLRHTHGAALRQRLPATQHTLPAAMALAGTQGTVTGQDYRGVEVLADIRPVPDTTWFMVAKIDTAEALATWRSQSVLIIALVIAVLAAAIVLGLAAWQRHEASSLRSLLTERKRTGTILRANEARFRAVFEGATDGILLADIESRAFVMANQAICDMLGTSEPELLALRVDDIHPEEDLPAVHDAFRRMAAGTSRLASNLPLRRKDGSILRVDITGVPLTLEGKTRLMGTFRDMTAFNELQAQMRQAQKIEAVGQLAGGIAHDFNNVLGVILGHCELAMAAVREDDPLHRSLDQIRASATRAASLTHQLLAFSRKQTLQPVVLDLNAIVRRMQSMLTRIIGEDIELVARLAEDLGRTQADPTQIEQIVVNLAVNARDAMVEAGGTLCIETANVELGSTPTRDHAHVVPGPYVMLAVSDTGHGMDAKTRERVFEPFFTTKEVGKGTGLGLSTVYGIVKQSGGSIWVYSEPGQGTTFKLYFPRTEEALQPSPRAEAPLRRGNGQRILVVEDEPGLRDVVREMLRDLGYRPTVASDGGEALLAVEEKELRPALLITDVVMPGISGRVLAKRLQATLPELRVLYMSGYTNAGAQNRGGLSADAIFIQKPFRLADLAAGVARALAEEPIFVEDGGPRPPR